MCTYAKMTHKPVPKERSGKHANVPGGEVHTDVWGPSPIQTLGGRTYYITFGVGAVGGRHVRLVSVAAASRGTQTRRGMGLGNKRKIGRAHV